jgi:hypothetical protein
MTPPCTPAPIPHVDMHAQTHDAYESWVLYTESNARANSSCPTPTPPA